MSSELADDGTDDRAEEPGPDWRFANANRLAVRRAVVGTLLRERRPMRVGEIVQEVLASRPVRWRGKLLTGEKVDDVLRYQERLGRVERVGRGLWMAIPSAFSRTGTWRYTRWERQWDLDPPSWINPSRRYPNDAQTSASTAAPRSGSGPT